MESYVKQCKEANSQVHLQDWRTAHLCRKLTGKNYVFQKLFSNGDLDKMRFNEFLTKS